VLLLLLDLPLQLLLGKLIQQAHLQQRAQPCDTAEQRFCVQK
jgi:hypothetical protein